MRITTVPLNQQDLVRRAAANGFTVTEAFSRPGPIPMHAHGQMSITILLDGAYEERYQPIHKPNTCEPGSVLVRPMGELHCNFLGHNGGRTLSIELEPDRVPALSALSYHRQGCFLDLGWAMSRELQNTDEAAPLALEALSLEVLARLMRGRRVNSSTNPPKWLQRARDLIHSGFLNHSLRMATLADEAGIHPVYFARVFRQVYGVTPGDYKRRLRLEWAREQIVSSSSSLAAIAVSAGFADQSHFARLFRRQFGMAPGAYRRIARD